VIIYLFIGCISIDDLGLKLSFENYILLFIYLIIAFLSIIFFLFYFLHKFLVLFLFGVY